MPTSPAKPQDSARSNVCRDRELVRYVGYHGLVTIGHIMAAMKVGQAITYRRVARCIEAGLLERHAVLHSEPTVIRATQGGIRWAGLGLPVASLSPGGVDHYLRCASVAQVLRDEFDERVFTEQQVALAEAIEQTRIASTEISDLPDGRPRFHRADLLVSGEKPIAVEVELTPKAPYRLRSIIRAWRRAQCVTQVRYYCREGAAHRAVTRAVQAVGADETEEAREKIVVIEGVPGDS